MTNNKSSDNEETQECPIESPTECPTCYGTGTIRPPPMVGIDVTGGIYCPKCKGSGTI